MKASWSRYALGVVLALGSGAAFGSDEETKIADEYGLVYSEESIEARARVTPRLKRELATQGLEWGAPVFMRIFKQPRKLELWLQQKDATFKLFKTYPICEFAGGLGPKRSRGDDQVPEGFYSVNPHWMHPFSDYHLAFNVRYPNDYDQFHKYTGANIMVHGGCNSSGCIAMTDPRIEEIYTLGEAAIRAGQPYFKVHIFPFPLTEANLKRFEKSPWHGFWQNLKQGYDLFETTRRPPEEYFADGRYQFLEAATTASCDIQEGLPLTPELAELLAPPLGSLLQQQTVSAEEPIP
ncbi:MAG: L,D-transpeptidase family protein [Nevskiales bacterium]